MAFKQKSHKLQKIYGIHAHIREGGTRTGEWRWWSVNLHFTPVFTVYNTMHNREEVKIDIVFSE